MNHILYIIGLIALIILYGYIQPRLLNRHYTIANLGFALLAVGFAAVAGTSFKNLGLGLGWLAFLIVAVIIFITISTGLVAKKQLRSLSLRGRYEIWLRIPIGTALSEELIFRAALLGLIMQYYSHMAALLVSSLVFGFWHVLPAQTWAKRTMPDLKLPEWFAKPLPGVSTIAFTTCAGILFGGLRLIAGSVWVPWSVHTFTNVAGWLGSKHLSHQGSLHGAN